jgi:hypothetical protein
MSVSNRKSFAVRWGRLINYKEQFAKVTNLDKNGEVYEVSFLLKSMTVEFSIFNKNKLISTTNLQITNNRKEDRHLCGIDVPIPSSEIMLYEKTRKSFDNMWDRVKTFWEITPNEECGVAYIEKNDENSNSFILRGFYEAETVFDPVLHRFGQAVGVKWHGATEIGNIFKAIGFIAEQCENNNTLTKEFIDYVKSNSRLLIKNEVVKNNSNDLKDHLDIIIDNLQMTETAKDKTIELAKQILSENEFEKCFMADNEKVLLYRFSSLIKEFVNSVKKKSENINLSNQ